MWFFYVRVCLPLRLCIKMRLFFYMRFLLKYYKGEGYLKKTLFVRLEIGFTIVKNEV